MKLLYPKYMQYKNRFIFRGKNASIKALLLFVVGMLFWTGVFIVFYRVLAYFQSIDVFGSFLASKLLSMVLLTFFSILIFSNIITAIASLFLSEELQLILGLPFDIEELYLVKLLEIIMNSSWMVLLFSLPVFLTYGIIFNQHATYYLMLAGTIPPFLIICGTAGVGAAIGLVKAFPARRLKDILFLLSLLLLIGLYLLFRFIQPERLVDPDAFITVIDYLSSLEMPASPFLPTQWITSILSSFLFNKSDKNIVFNLLLLWSTAGASIVLLGWTFRLLFHDTWSKSQEGRSARITRNKVFNWILEQLMIPLPPQVQAVIDKDIRSFFRDTAQWSQLFILGAIIIIYLYNFSVLPIDKSPLPTRYLQNLIAFLNLGLAGFVIAAVSVRFGFPALSMEGESFWIIKSSPLSLNRFLWCKFWLTFIFMSILSEMLIICTNILLQVDYQMMLLSIMTVFLMTAGLTSLSIGLGAVFPRFRYENIAQIPTGFGGLLYMILAMLFVGAIVVLEAWPVHLFIMSGFMRKALTRVQLAEIMISFMLVFVLSCIAYIVPMRLGLKRLSEYEQL